MRIKHFLLLGVIFLAGCQGPLQVNQNQTQDQVQVNVNKQNEPVNTSTPSSVKKPDLKPATGTPPVTEPVIQPIQPTSDLPKFLDYQVAFASQAPFGNWDALHEETCEEAAMTMAAKYVKNESLSPHIMEQTLLSLVKWEGENGYKIDITAQEAVDILATYFNVKSILTTKITTAEIKNQLVAGNIMIIPAAGRHLGNPNFKAPGPIYHMLVIRGYDDKTGEFITNDPGTRLGEGYRYKYQVLIDAIHDWDHQWDQNGQTATDQQMLQGRKVMIIVSK